jgi:isopenicillin N synthase-like dioxygenase
MTELQSRTKTDIDREDLSARKLDFDSIPIIDIADLDHTDLDKRVAVAAQIKDACERVGFFYVRNHGIGEKLLNEVYSAAREFFALPAEEKLIVDITKSNRHRGYCAMGVLQADVNNPDAFDRQEAYEVSVELPENDQDYIAGNPMYGPNLWPDHPPAFRTQTSAYVNEMIRLGNHLFRGFALALGLDEHWFDDKVTKPMAQLRVIRYPPQEPGPIDPKTIGIGAHTDYECFTILSQSAPGLQVQNASGQWVEAPPIEGALLINIGDCMERWTNDQFRSTLHRVINRSGRERYSLAFFYGANYHAVVECLPVCLNDDRPAKYPPVRAGEWTIRNIQAAYKYKPNLL